MAGSFSWDELDHDVFTFLYILCKIVLLNVKWTYCFDNNILFFAHLGLILTKFPEVSRVFPPFLSSLENKQQILSSLRIYELYYIVPSPSNALIHNQDKKHKISYQVWTLQNVHFYTDFCKLYHICK